MKCLIVEDDFTSRLFLQKQLEHYGDCHVAVNGVEAVQAVHTAMDMGQPYDLICLDIMMPQMDGQAALREIRGMEEARGILSSDGAKLLMTTALNDMQNVSTAYCELADGYLVKPIDRTELVAFLEKSQLLGTGETCSRPRSPRSETARI